MIEMARSAEIFLGNSTETRYFATISMLHGTS